MEMKEQTIVDKYARLGVKPKILAELNACPTKDIEDILAKAGVYTPKQTKKRVRIWQQNRKQHRCQKSCLIQYLKSWTR